ncbi:Semaphorin-6D [Schistosoma japonicum]|nr:Semaphorin-6D [Schistosoma japonicum]
MKYSKQFIHFVCILKIFQSLLCEIHSLDFNAPIYKIVYIDDLIVHPKWMSTHRSFVFPKGSRIIQFSVHQLSNSLFVAVNNSIIRISTDTFLKNDEATWSLSNQDLSTCPLSNSDRQISCNQYAVTLVKVVDKLFSGLSYSPLHQTGIYVCLSNGLIAECSLRQANNLRAPSKMHWKSVDHCPIDPSQPAIGFVASTQNLYIGTKTGSSKNAEIIIMKIKSTENLNSMKPFKYPVRTLPDDRMIKQNNNTVFVHSFEFHNAVYFLFRELADETIESCDKSLDDGNNLGIFNNFLKATITCPSTPEDGSNSLVFTELQAVHVDQSTKTLFGTFQTSSSMPTASAICEYSLVEIESVFNGEFYKTDGIATTTRNEYNCDKIISNAFSKSDYHLMFKTVRPRYDRPILVQQGEIYTQIVVSKIPGTLRSDMNMVIFVTNSNGMLHKWHIKEFQSCLVELIYLVPKYSKNLSTNNILMEIIHNNQNKKISKESYVLIAIENRLLRLPIARCKRFGDERIGCKLLRDPYCGWNEENQKCDDLSNEEEIHNNIVTYHSDTCDQSELVSNIKIKSEWGSWSQWSSCKHVSDKYKNNMLLTQYPSKQIKLTGCICRFRSCNSLLFSELEENECSSGSSVEISNCSYNGGWTEWSAWSGCEPVCYTQHHNSNVTQIRTRYRSCSNPSPVGNAHKCHGPDKQTEICTKEIVMCSPEISTFGWTSWSHWTSCTVSCNGGKQFRRRHCKYKNGFSSENIDMFTLDEVNVLLKDQSLMNTDNLLCIGKAFEDRECNTNPCSVTKITSLWSDWYITDESGEKENIQRRYRVECSAKLPESENFQAQIDTQTRICKIEKNSYEVNCEDLDKSFENYEKFLPVLSENVKADWSSWTDCSQPCGGGSRYRKRIKSLLLRNTDDKHNKNDYEIEHELCNLHSCKGYWSCWSEWSDCSQTEPCAKPRGVQRRFRTCINEFSSSTGKPTQAHNTNLCYGGFENSMQTVPCELKISETECLQERLNQVRRRERSVEVKLSNTQKLLHSSEWAIWSECINVEQLSYAIRVRTRSCENCEWIEFQRCDTRKHVAPEEVLGEKYQSYKETILHENSAEQYDMLHAIIVILVSFTTGFAIVIIPFITCTIRDRKNAQRKLKCQQSTSLPTSIWRKITKERLLNKTQSNLLPYEWLLESNNQSTLKSCSDSKLEKQVYEDKGDKWKEKSNIHAENIDNLVSSPLLINSDGKHDENHDYNNDYTNQIPQKYHLTSSYTSVHNTETPLVQYPKVVVHNFDTRSRTVVKVIKPCSDNNNNPSSTLDYDDLSNDNRNTLLLESVPSTVTMIKPMTTITTRPKSEVRYLDSKSESKSSQGKVISVLLSGSSPSERVWSDIPMTNSTAILTNNDDTKHDVLGDRNHFNEVYIRPAVNCRYDNEISLTEMDETTDNKSTKSEM